MLTAGKTTVFRRKIVANIVANGSDGSTQFQRKIVVNIVVNRVKLACSSAPVLDAVSPGKSSKRRANANRKNDKIAVNNAVNVTVK